MVQRNKIGIIKSHHKSDTNLGNLRPSSSSSSLQTHEKMKKIMKKSRSIKGSDESPFKNKKPQQLHTNEPGSAPGTPQKQSPNYMKSTSSFEARKEQSPKTPSPSRNSTKNDQSASGVKGSRRSSLKMMTKTPSFKPLRPSKKVILCEDMEAQRATCSSTLKESKFPNYLQLDPGDGTSAMKVCPYSYCSLNGHHHAPVPPLKCFLSARRRAQKGFKLGCLSTKPNAKKFDIAEMVISAPEEENRDHDLECSDMEWEEGYCSESDLKLQEIDEDEIGKKSVESLYDEDETGKTSVERLYDEESVSSGAWSEEDGDSESESWCEQMNINQDYDKYDAEPDTSGKLEGVNGDENMNYQKEETFQESKTEKFEVETDKNHTTIIYNIIQFNISVFVDGEKTMDKSATCDTGDKMEAKEERVMSDNKVNQMVEDEEELLPSSEQLITIEKQEASVQSNSIDEEPAAKSDVDQSHDVTSEPDKKTNSSHTGCKKPSEEIVDDSQEFNPRGPNFLPETADPDAKTVDLRHQMMDERKNAEEWMVDFALQQAVTTLAPARKRKVALLVEAFEQVMPDPHETRNRYASKDFTNSRLMQACS
ncbi:hypothetical protein R6Q57_009941 [Mikania cordata]